MGGVAPVGELKTILVPRIKLHNIMDFNTCVTEYNKGNVVIEDVLFECSWDGDTYDVTLCGPFGIELSSMTLNHIEFDHLKEVDLVNCNFLPNEF